MQFAFLDLRVQAFRGMDVMGNRPIQNLPEFGPGDIARGCSIAIAAFFPLSGSLITVEDIGFGNFGAPVFDQDFFNQVLDHFNRRCSPFRELHFQFAHNLGRKIFRGCPVPSANSNRSTINGVANALGGKGDDASIAFDYMGEFCHSSLLEENNTMKL